jgi:hypothetical protein
MTIVHFSLPSGVFILFIFQYLSIQFLNSHMETGTCQVAHGNPEKSGLELSHCRDHSFLFGLLSVPGKAVTPAFPVLLVQFL